MNAELRYLLLDEAGQVWVYNSLEELTGSIESYDVADDVYTAWDIDGRRIELLVSDADRYRVEARITTVDEQQQMRAALERWVDEGLKLIGRPPLPTSSLTTAELAHQAYRLQQPPPSLWQRLRRRGRKR